MKRPMFLAALIALAAVICTIYQPWYMVCIVGFVIEAGLILYLYRRQIPYIYMWILLVFPLLVGITDYQRYNLYYYQHETDEYLELEGAIIDVSTNKGKIIIVVKTNLLNQASLKLEVEEFDGLPGDKYRIAGWIKHFERPTNPGQFNVRQYYISKNIQYTFQCDYLEKLEDNSDGIEARAYKLRERLGLVFNEVYDTGIAGTMRSIVLGDKSELDSDTKQMFQQNGIAHLLAISGLHISIVGMLLYKLLRRRNTLVVAGVISVFVMLFYLILTGNAVSARRAVIMILIVILADILGRTSDDANTYGIALLVTLLDNPYSIWDIGFLMSYSAYAGIIFVYPIFSNRDRFLMIFERLPDKKYTLGRMLLIRFSDSLIMSLSISLATMPFVLSYSYEIPVHSLLLNLLVIPLMSVVMISGIGVGIVGLFSMAGAVFFAGAGTYIVSFYKLLCEGSRALGLRIVVLGCPSLLSCVLYISVLIALAAVCFFGGDYFLSERKMFSKVAGVWLILLIVAISNLRYKCDGNSTLTMLDVGQGDAGVYETKEGYTILFDGGSTSKGSVGKNIITKYLKYTGKNRVDYVFVSHTDEDHISGIVEIIEAKEIDIGILVMPKIKDYEAFEEYVKLISLAKAKGIEIKYATCGQEIAFKEESIICLHPCENYSYKDSNDFSAVYLITNHSAGVLMMGDASESAERCMIQDLKRKAKTENLSYANVLKVGHHGSKTSTSEELLNSINIKAALVSAGKNNIYGHPHLQTVTRLEEKNVRMYNTALVGAITVTLEGEKIKIKCFKVED